MHKHDHLTGITPILLKRAAYYLQLGVGEYFPEHPHFDRVVVSTNYDIQENPEDPFEWGLGLKVSFFRGEHCTRWIDFGCRTTGAGGDVIMHEVIDEEVSSDT